MAITKRDEGGKIVSKFTPEFMEHFLEVLTEEEYAYAFTEEELITKVNAKFDDPDKRITPRSWRNYKKRLQESGEDNPLLEELAHAVALMRVDKKSYFLRQMEDTGNASWMRFGWMLERVFPEMQMNSRVEHKHEITDKRPKQIVFEKPKELEDIQDAEVIED